MVVYGLGMGLTSAPATESIMGAVSRRQAGVGSAVNDSTRLLGGTLGVAVLGSVYASLYGSRLTARLPAGLPAQVKDIAHQSLGAAYAVSARVPGTAGQAVHDAATNAFLHGLSVGCLVAGGVAAAGAVLAVFFLPSQPASPSVQAPSSVRLSTSSLSPPRLDPGAAACRRPTTKCDWPPGRTGCPGPPTGR